MILAECNFFILYRLYVSSINWALWIVGTRTIILCLSLYIIYIYIYIYMYIYVYIYIYMYIYIYVYIRSICTQQLFRSLRAHQYSSDQKKILKNHSAQTTTRVVNVANRLWLPFLINRVLNLTKLRSVIFVYIYTYRNNSL